jgi:cytochrome c oxidase subunit 1
MAFVENAANGMITYDYPASAYTLMGIMGISGVVAVLGGAIFILVTVLSVFLGKPVESESTYGFTTSTLTRADPVVVPDGGHEAAGKWGLAAPGTFLLALFFLMIFVLYYAVNWKYLASVWPMS